MVTTFLKPNQLSQYILCLYHFHFGENLTKFWFKFFENYSVGDMTIKD